ncbi:MAG: hypothetical protein MI757_10600 [Pirellulales bacterium]|nr:hypothetical protein [Pirellulales bacterium]
MAALLSIKLAKQNVDSYEAVIEDSRRVEQCHELDDILKLGNEAFGWAKRTYDYFGKQEIVDDDDVDWFRCVVILIKRWVSHFETVKQLIDEFRNNGLEPEYAADFLNCEKEARRILSDAPHFDGEQLPTEEAERALEQAAVDSGVDLDDLLAKATQNLQADVVIPPANQLTNDNVINDLIADDQRAYRG